MLYHKQIGLPITVNKALGHYVCKFTMHSLVACLNDRYGKVKPPLEIDVTKENVIEIEILGQSIAKVVIRQAYNQDKDLSMALIPDGNRAIVKTLWLNDKADNHQTLDESKYFKV